MFYLCVIAWRSVPNPIFMKRCDLFVSLLLLSLLIGCGGGSLDSDTDQPTANILVSAGPDQSVNEGVTVTLGGEASGQTEAITYTWSSVPEITITQESTSAAAASFVAPQTTETLNYSFTLVAVDGNGNQASDTVGITILPVNALPTARILVSQPALSADAEFPAGVQVVLDGSSSADTDAQANIDPISAYRWQQTAGQDVLTGVSLDSDDISFITPILDENSVLTFSLRVTDQEGGEGTAEISLSVLSASNTVPTVNAGVDHQVYSGESILLTGVAATSIPQAQPLSYSWLNDSALTPVISAPNDLKTFAIAPSVNSQQSITFTIEVTDAFGNKVEDNLSVIVKPLPIIPINDTGVALQATASQVGTLHQADFPGQDAQRGADVIARNGLLEKAGRGDQGFDFTRLDDIGDEQDDISQPWRCVRDNVTGLVWEIKTTDAGLHDSSHTYSWYFTEDAGGFNGDQSGTGTSCTITNCNTQAFIDQVNSVGLCNFYDWRLPTHNELLSILHLGNTASPMIDADYFPNTVEGITPPAWYWTRIPSVDGASDVARNAWTIDFATGNDNFLNKSTPASIRLVRGGR